MKTYRDIRKKIDAGAYDGAEGFSDIRFDIYTLYGPMIEGRFQQVLDNLPTTFAEQRKRISVAFDVTFNFYTVSVIYDSGYPVNELTAMGFCVYQSEIRLATAAEHKRWPFLAPSPGCEDCREPIVRTLSVVGILFGITSVTKAIDEYGRVLSATIRPSRKSEINWWCKKDTIAVSVRDGVTTYAPKPSNGYWL
jgi:hypothetical protein